MSSPENQSPIEAAKKAVTDSRQAVHASRVEHDTALAQLEAARGKYLADSTAKHQTAVISAEDSARFAEMRMTAATQKFEATKAAHAAHVASEKNAALEARRADCSHDKFVAACAKAAERRAELRARIAEVEADIAARVRNYEIEAQACGAAAIDYLRLSESLTLRASGLDASAILKSVWGGAPAQAMSAEETLSLAERGVSLALVNAKLAALRDAVRRQASAAAKVAQGLFLGPKAAPSTTPLGQFETCALEVRSTRLELNALGFGKAADAVASDERCARLERAGATKVENLLRQLRGVNGTPVGDYLTDAERANRRDALAAPLLAALTELGFAEEAAAVRPPARQTVAHTITPVGASNFAEVGAS